MPGTHTNLLYHLVFSTKRRIPLITQGLRDELYRYLGGIVRGNGGRLLEIGGMPDHVHLLARLRPTPSVSDVLQHVKGDSSKWVNHQKARAHKFGWQQGYAAFSVSESQVPHVVCYIRDQPQHHGRKTFQQEFAELLNRHHVDYDERYLWD